MAARGVWHAVQLRNNATCSRPSCCAAAGDRRAAAGRVCKVPRPGRPAPGVLFVAMSRDGLTPLAVPPPHTSIATDFATCILHPWYGELCSVGCRCTQSTAMPLRRRSRRCLMRASPGRRATPSPARQCLRSSVLLALCDIPSNLLRNLYQIIHQICNTFNCSATLVAVFEMSLLPLRRQKRQPGLYALQSLSACRYMWCTSWQPRPWRRCI